MIDTNLHNLFNINNDTIYGTAHMYIATYITVGIFVFVMLIPILKYTISTNSIKIIYNKVKIIPISTILFN
ncbi:hypothetical protein KWX43_20015, partial [Clostridioides difficile]|nr:hypothetical protein [Clostridioides difficile]